MCGKLNYLKQDWYELIIVKLVDRLYIVICYIVLLFLFEIEYKNKLEKKLISIVFMF